MTIDNLWPDLDTLIYTLDGVFIGGPTNATPIPFGRWEEPEIGTYTDRVPLGTKNGEPVKLGTWSRT